VEEFDHRREFTPFPVACKCRLVTVPPRRSGARDLIEFDVKELARPRQIRPRTMKRINRRNFTVEHGRQGPPVGQVIRDTGSSSSGSGEASKTKRQNEGLPRSPPTGTLPEAVVPTLEHALADLPEALPL
jgi:hypothetical protein